MSRPRTPIDEAIETFVRGFCHSKSATHPYEAIRQGRLWIMRDAPRKNPRYYRKEEWVAYGAESAEVDAAARSQTRGRFFVCPVVADGEADEPVLAAYKQLGYRLLAREGLFRHSLGRISRTACPAKLHRVQTSDLAARFGKATRTKPIQDAELAPESAVRQYVAADGDALVGWVRSTAVGSATWCSNMFVQPEYRRRGIGRALLARMLRDDRARGAKASILLASRIGALLYPEVGYERIGTLMILAPKRTPD
jgi:predicted N-acetyltransferase YhbS